MTETTDPDLKAAILLLSVAQPKVNTPAPLVWQEQRNTLINKYQDLLGHLFEAG